MSFWRVDWRKTVDKYQGRSNKFLMASRRLNILSNDMLRYMALCESVANLARDGQLRQTEMNAEIIKLSKIKNKATQMAASHKLNSYNQQLEEIHKTLLVKTRELEVVRKRYKKHLDIFADAIK